MKMPENCEEGSNNEYNVVSRRTCSILMGKISALIVRLFGKVCLCCNFLQNSQILYYDDAFCCSKFLFYKNRIQVLYK